MRDVICNNCKKLLLKIAFGHGEIKCKCGQLVEFKIVSQKSLVEEIYT